MCVNHTIQHLITINEDEEIAMREVTPGHFVFCSAKEFATLQAISGSRSIINQRPFIRMVAFFERKYIRYCVPGFEIKDMKILTPKR